MTRHWLLAPKVGRCLLGMSSSHPPLSSRLLLVPLSACATKSSGSSDKAAWEAFTAACESGRGRTTRRASVRQFLRKSEKSQGITCKSAKHRKSSKSLKGIRWNSHLLGRPALAATCLSGGRESWCLAFFGHLMKGDSRALNGDTVFEPRLEGFGDNLVTPCTKMQQQGSKM